MAISKTERLLVMCHDDKPITFVAAICNLTRSDVYYGSLQVFASLGALILVN
jgi:hypothetical protein